MNTQKTAKKRNPLTLILGIGIPTFLLAIMVVAGVLSMGGGISTANALSLTGTSLGHDRASLGNALRGTNRMVLQAKSCSIQIAVVVVGATLHLHPMQPMRQAVILPYMVLKVVMDRH